jgi:hypothetical protein
MTFNLAALQHTLETRERLTLEIPEFRRAAVLVGVQLEPEPTLVLTQFRFADASRANRVSRRVARAQ